MWTGMVEEILEDDIWNTSVKQWFGYNFKHGARPKTFKTTYFITAGSRLARNRR